MSVHPDSWNHRDTLGREWLVAYCQPFINGPKMGKMKNAQLREKPIFLVIYNGQAFKGIDQLTFVYSCTAWAGGEISL